MLPSSRRRGFPSLFVYALRNHFPSFRQLRNLTFPNAGVEPTVHEHLGLFSAFQHTLSSLSLTQARLSPSSGVSHISEISTFARHRFGWTTCPFLNVQLSRPLRGKSVIKPFWGDGMKSFFLCSPNSSRSTRNLYLRLSPCRFSCGEPHISQNIPM